MALETFSPHSQKQSDVIFSDADITILGTGTQWGKSLAASQWFRRIIHEEQNPGTNFILGAPTYKILNQSALPYFLNTMRDIGEYNKGEASFELTRGRKVYVRTEHDPDSVVGIPNVKGYWIDEADKVRLYFWENLQARAASKGARGMLSTSPYSLGWLYKQYIKPYERGKFEDSHVKLIQAASWENPYHRLSDPEAKKKQEKEMDSRRFKMVFGGQWGRMEGLVYDCWDDDINLCPAVQLPSDTVYYGGIDWGYTHPFVLMIRAITPSGHQFGVSEFYKTGLTISDIVEVCKQKKQIYNVKIFFCDPSRPENIEELNRNKVPAVGAENDIRLGIDKHYRLIKEGKYKEFIGSCPYAADERESYHYPEPKELKQDQDDEDQLPVDANNHVMDATRYLSVMLANKTFQQLKSPYVPEEKPKEESHEGKIRRLQSERRQKYEIV